MTHNSHTVWSVARRFAALTCAAVVTGLVACDNGTTTPTGPSFRNNPCVTSGTVTLASAQALGIDCSDSGTTVTFAGNGASYLVVAQFATEQGVNDFVPYTLFTGTPISAAIASSATPSGRWSRPTTGGSPAGGPDIGLVRTGRPGLRQAQFEGALLARGRARARAGAYAASALRAQRMQAAAAAIQAPPAVGSVRSFHVLSSFGTTPTWATVGARLQYAGSSLLLYVDTLAPPDGFTQAQLQHFGGYSDSVLVPIDTATFGQPSDIDQNGRVIMLMSPVVNADSPKAQCATQGFVSGFFDPEDFFGPSDSVSNQGEIFYSIVPDSNGTVSCAHSVSAVDFDVPATFLHELQHIIDFSQHVVLGTGQPGASWIDEGLSIVAEEMGSRYYEQKCPPPACRADPAQLFPDSAQPFVQDFLYDSYEYALLPDTASVTLHTDDENGFGWRGGDWLLMRYLGDQFGDGIFKALERGPADGVADIEAVTGQAFPQLFAQFGLALYADSLPGLPRNTAPAADRFASRNVSQLWVRLFTTAGPASDIPVARPIVPYPITSDSSSAVMDPGTMSFFRLDTPANAATVTIQFSQPGGQPFAPSQGPQLAVFRLPPGQ
jgi:hypothetical protein